MSLAQSSAEQRHYLDHASTTPLRPEAAAAVREWLTSSQGDPSRMHREAMEARIAVETAREKVATMLGARSREVVFTSGGTEAIAAACWGASERTPRPTFVLSAIEHSCVRESAELFAGVHGGSVTVVGAEPDGTVSTSELVAAITEHTCLVHIQLANHEVGTLQPAAEVVAACKERGVLVHVDAAAAAGHVAIDFAALGADLLSVSSHKLGGPPGTGALLVRRGLRLSPLLRGSDQERARRAGFENVVGIVGFGAAAAALDATRLAEESDTASRRTAAIRRAVAGIDGARSYGPPDRCLPHIACIGFEGVEPQAVLLEMDRAGIAVHSGSACASESLEPSPVLAAMGVDADRSLRASVGWSTTDADVDAFLQALPRALSRLRELAN